jgi:hypothetical protein
MSCAAQGFVIVFSATPYSNYFPTERRDRSPTIIPWTLTALTLSQAK